jgi:Protein involved in meta-pathway of phenol degradation
MPVTSTVCGYGIPPFDEFRRRPRADGAEFKNYHQDFIFGMSLRVTAPLSQYDGDKLVNIGTNRWSFKPEIGFSKAFGPWTVELVLASLFTRTMAIFLEARRARWRRFTLCNQGSATPSRLAAGWR